MISAGMESILIKVAGIGLSIKHLGKTLREMQSTLVKLVNMLFVFSTTFLKRRTRMRCMDPTYAEKVANTKL